MRHLIEGLTEVQKTDICLVLYVDRVRQFMYSTDELCLKDRPFRKPCWLGFRML